MQAGHSQPGGLLNSGITAWDSGVCAPILNNVSVMGDINISQKSDTRLSAGKSTDITSVINEYKKSIVSEYSYTKEYTSRPGEHVLLQDRYIDPMIIQRHREKKEQEKEMKSKGNQFFNLRTNRSISIFNLFGQEDGSGTRPKSVILQGNSGNGKSFTAQKIILDWATGDLFKEMLDLVFHLRCSEVNGISEDISLVELLNCSDDMTQILKDEQQKILFLVDGFDELRLELPSKPLPVSAEIKAKPGAVLSSLLRGTMLKQSFILVTTRSVATDHLGKLLKTPQRFTEIVGFSEKGVQEYFHKFFADKELADKVHEQLKTNEVLYTACFSPVMCWLICSVFNQKGETYTKTTAGLESSTCVLVDFVLTLLEHHCQGLNPSQQLILVKNLGQIAEKGMLEGEVFFEKHVLQEFIPDLVSIPFICIHHHKERMNVKERFSFIHLSFQEFFSAFFYILLDEDQAREKVKELLFSCQEKRHLLPVIRFLFGLVNKKASALLEEKFQHVVSHEVCVLLEEWIYTRIELCSYSDEFNLLCLYEIKNDSIVSKAMQIWEKNEGGITLWLGSSQRTDFRAAAYCLQFCSSIRRLGLNGCTMENVRMLRPALRKCDELRLTLTDVSDADVDDLIQVLEKAKGLRDLLLKHCPVTDHNVERIMSTLRKNRLFGDVHLTVEAINNNTKILMNYYRRGNPKPTELRNPEFEKHNDELLSFLLSVPRLRLVKLQANALPQTCMEKIRLCVQQKDNWFHVERVRGVDDEDISVILPTHDTRLVTIEVHLADDIPAPSLIKLTIPSSGILKLDGAGLLNKMKQLKGLSANSYMYDTQLNELLSFLRSVPDLLKLKLEIKNLTMSWVTRILSFKTCPSLTEICVDTDSMIMEETIMTLKNSWTCQHCVLITTGSASPKPNWKPSRNPTCNKGVKLTVRRGIKRKLMYGQCETDSEKRQ